MLVLLALIIGGWWWSASCPTDPRLKSFGLAATNTTVGTTTNNQPDQTFIAVSNALVSAKSAAERSAALAQLARGGSTSSLVAAIRQLLDSKTDVVTGLGFKVGKDGALKEAPTLRIFLLDELAKIDPAAAAAVAREVLNNSNSPDEWAVALRNLARGDTSADGRALLATKTEELLRNQSWQQNASIGYLEAFDTAVYLGGTNLVTPLADLLRMKDNPAVAHAAFLALDRMTFNDPTAMLETLEAHSDWLQGREETRADYFARADVGNAGQRGIVESYLLDASRTPAELSAFAGVFPNANFMISQNLLTESSTLDGATLRQRDQVSLQVVNEWIADPRFTKLKAPLTKLQQRLQQFVNPGR